MKGNASFDRLAGFLEAALGLTKKCVAALAPSRRLQWLQAKDVEERSEWVTRFREGTSPLGVVIKQVMEARDAHWVVTSAATANGAGEQQATGGTGQASLPPPPPQVSHFREGPKVGGKGCGRA